VRLTAFAMCSSVLLCASLSGCSRGSPPSPAASPEVYSIRVEPASLALRAGSEAQLAAQAQDAHGAITGGAAFAFSSLDPQIAQVTTTGRVGARGSTGSTQLRVASGGREAMVTVVVTAGPAARSEVIAAPSAQTVAGGSLGTVRVRVVDDYGNGLDHTPVNWRVTQGGGALTDVATHTSADGSAAVTWQAGSGVGTQTLEFTSDGLPPRLFTALAQTGPAARLQIQLSDKAKEGTADLVIGQPAQLIASVADATGNPVAGVVVTFERATSCSFEGGRVATGETGTTAPISWVPGTGKTCRITARVEGTEITASLDAPIRISRTAPRR